MAERLPLLFGMDEIHRLHGVAYVAAIQTGAKGIELDEVTSEIFVALAKQANRSVVKAQARPPLQLVE